MRVRFPLPAPSIFFIFNDFSHKWARPHDVFGTNRVQWHPAYFQSVAGRWALAVANKLYIVSVVYT
jgi:hypothetical protein